ncbi:MAG: HAMP domain-containing histidine kinase [Clostridiales bacterium]|nr:HAMP domain-containing histidine kinase [Clostridiales bacterium]
MGVFTILLLIIEVVLIIVVKDYYYSSAKQYVNSKMNVVIGAITNYSESSGVNYSSELRSIVENYEDKDKIEIMAIDTAGDVAITSSGFLPSLDTSVEDLTRARSNSTGTASAVFELPTGEKVLAVTSMLPPGNNEYEAVRMLVSLKSIDGQIIFLAIIMTLIMLCIIGLVFFSGSFFIKSIVYPVRQIGEVARKFAKGDFSQRIEKANEDELGELCDSINYMANELSNSEAMKNEFISSVSHELRTPLTAIKGWSETLASIDDKEMSRKGLRVISSETERLSQMVEELLDFSRIQDGRLTLQMDRIDILAELAETVLIYQERAKITGITLDYYEPEMLPFVMGDKNRIKQVFINIVDNAIKYSDKGGRVSVEAYEQDGDICVTVSDTGLGISNEDLPKIKTKFFKANHTRRGSGIGLAVADEIITMHGGVLSLNSEMGIGTTVMITLPTIEPMKKNENIETVNVEVISTSDEPTDEQ